MSRLFLISFFICLALLGFTQNHHIDKPILDTSVLGKFPFMVDARISNDGRYISYLIKGLPIGSSTLVVQSTETDWKRELMNPPFQYAFVINRQYAFLVKDSLFFWHLGKEEDEFITGVSSFKQPKTEDWLAYQLKSPAGELVIHNYLTGHEQRFSNVREYTFDDAGHVLLLKTRDEVASRLQWVDLQSYKIFNIWYDTAATVSSYAFDEENKQLAFLVESKKRQRPAYSLWYYRKGMDNAVMKADDQSAGIDSNLFIANISPSFSANSQHIFFKLSPLPDRRKPLPDAVKVNIWSYKDSVIQSLQLLDKKEKTYWASIPIGGDHVFRLEQEDEMSQERDYSDFVVVRNKISINEYWWPSYRQGNMWLLSRRDGVRRLLPFAKSVPSFSPRCRYMIYFDREKRHYFRYDLVSGCVKNISAGIPFPLYDEEWVTERTALTLPNSYGVVGWLEDESGLLVYDKYDIWQLDPEGIKVPVNLSNGYGRRHHIQLRLLVKASPKGICRDSSVILTAFNTLTKYTGYYRTNFGQKRTPERLTMDACTWGSTFYSGTDPIKARDVNRWIVSRQTANEAPDYYFTADFTHFKRLTHLQPQENFNWLNTELIIWRRRDGRINQGILYKPENFDSKKKYPLIFYYYEKLSQELFTYMRPNFSDSRMDIPWFVSHGYLVFTPDIHYTIGRTGQSVYLSVVSAAQYLSKFSFVDAKRMGLQGHSFGGYETNYLVSHTRLFAAAAEAAGISDCVSGYGAIRGRQGQENQINQTIAFENGQYRTGTSLWAHPEVYIENSPIFKANHVTTPLLIMHNKGDANVPWSQAVEWYTGLRRLGKKVWMLEYDEGTHAVGGRDAVDYTLRLTQFFDHYLKGALPPKWMTEGIPARLKGIETGYESDTSGKMP